MSVVFCPMADGLSDLYQDLLTGSYDCIDRIILNAYFRMGHSPGGFHVWWQALTGSDDTLDNTHPIKEDVKKKDSPRPSGRCGCGDLTSSPTSFLTSFLEGLL